MGLSYGLCPFWFWNGSMENEMIQSQVRMMYEAGIGGFMIQARQGLTIPYLSHQWFEKVGVAVEAAKRYGMDVWLCDEYPYPSGNAGGEVLLEHPEYAAVQLQVLQRDLSGSQEFVLDLPWGEPVLAVAYPLAHGEADWSNPVDLRSEIGIISPDRIYQKSGLTQYNRKRFFSGRPRKQLHWLAPGGDWRVYLFIQVVTEHQKFFGKFIDPLNRQAVECFIRVTHEKYREYVGAEFGKTIKGFFVDEIEPQPAGKEMRWSPLLPELFQQRKGYSLISNLPALVTPFGRDTAKIRYDYWDVVTQSFIDTFDRPVADWCHANHLLYAGEKPILRSSQLQYLDVPGIDVGHQKVNSVPAIADPYYRANAKLLGSAAHFYGKSRALCECFHSVGWGMTLQDMRWMIDWIAVQGVNLFVPHAFFYTTNGLTKHDAPPSSFYQNPAWIDMDLLSRHVKALSEVSCDYQRQVDILVIDPITSRWTARGEKSAIAKKLANDFSQLQQVLLRNHFDFYIIDPQKLAESHVSGTQLVVGGERFQIVILPPMLNLECDAWQRLKEFIAANGCVIGTKCLPVEAIDAGTTDIGQLLGNWFGVDTAALYRSYCSEQSELPQAGDSANSRRILLYDSAELPRVLTQSGVGRISISTAGQENELILVNHYRKEDQLYIFMVNTSGAPQAVTVNWDEIKQDCQVHEILTATARRERHRVEVTLAADRVVLHTELAPFQSRLFEISGSPSSLDTPVGLPPEDFDVAVLWLDTIKDWDVRVPWNALRLDQWQLRVEQIESEPVAAESNSGMVRCCPIINQVAESGISLPVRLADHFGCPWELTLPSLTCSYRAEWTVEVMPSEAWLVMEEGAIGGEWQVVLNGQTLPTALFTVKAFYAADNRALFIQPFLKPGRNCLDVKVKILGTGDGLLNPLYLCGDFGVFASSTPAQWSLGALPVKGPFKQLVQSGLPFYAGTIAYTTHLNLAKTQTPLRLGIKDIEEAAELLINGHSVGALAWEPFIWEVSPEWVNQGDNLVEIRLCTTLLGLYEGSYFDRESHCYREY